MKYHVSLFIYLFFFLTSCDLKSSKKYFTDAEKLEEQQKYKEAIQLLDKALAKNEKFLDGYINRGADKSAIGDFKGAISDYEKVLSIDIKNTLALFNIGNNYKRLEDYKTAVVYYNKAFVTKGGEGIDIDYTPDNYFHIDFGKFDVSAREIYYERGIAFYQLDSLQKSYTDFKHCLNKNYMKADCYNWIGYIYLSTGQKKIACENFHRAKELGDTTAITAINKYCKD